MRATVEKIALGSESCYWFKVRNDPAFEFWWHFHPEYELTLIEHSRGRRFVGDSIADYRDGDLVLIGPNLPHTWYSTRTKNRSGHRAIVAQFADKFLGEGFFDRPELKEVAALLKRSAVGLSFAGPARDQAARKLCEMPKLRGLDRLLALLAALGDLARCPDARPLASQGFLPVLDLNKQRRINAVCTYINESHAGSISQRAAARLAHMSPSAFSHFFKRTVGKTFINHLNEIRVGHACELLIESNLSIMQVAYASGFPNLSYFNRRFLKLKQMTPRAYRRQFAVNAASMPSASVAALV